MNQYASRTNETSCTFCHEGSVAKNEGQATCQNCSAGRSGAGCLACQVGQFRDAESTNPLICNRCPSGFFIEKVASASCFPCVPGRFVSGDGASKCDLCSANTFAVEEASSNCSMCGQGTSSNNGSAVCTPCSAGRAGTPCKDCETGSFRSPEDPSIACLHCPKGYYQDLTAQAACLPCFP